MIRACRAELFGELCALHVTELADVESHSEPVLVRSLAELARLGDSERVRVDVRIDERSELARSDFGAEVACGFYVFVTPIDPFLRQSVQGEVSRDDARHARKRCDARDRDEQLELLFGKQPIAALHFDREAILRRRASSVAVSSSSLAAATARCVEAIPPPAAAICT